MFLIIFFVLNFASLFSDFIQEGTICHLPQKACWVNEEDLVVGRWDGTIQHYHFHDELVFNDVVLTPLNEKRRAPVTVLEPISETKFVSSAGPCQLAIWEINSQISLNSLYPYNSTFGSLTCSVVCRERKLLVTGHFEGILCFWKIGQDSLQFIDSLDIRSPSVLLTPFPLDIISSLAFTEEGILIASSEDGYLRLIDVESRKKKFEVLYSSSAKRGINQLSYANSYVLITSCPVGEQDSNLWLYRVSPTNFMPLDKKHLKVSTEQDQTYAFHVLLYESDTQLHFLCSTGEGLIWQGRVEEEKLIVDSFQRGSLRGGAALALHPSKKWVVAAGDDLLLFRIFPLIKVNSKSI